MAKPDEVLAFWLDEVGPKGWYEPGDGLDDEIREKFGDTWQRAMDGAMSLWLTYPSGTLAYIILTDQFPRNMFRDTGRAFSSDHVALTAAKMAITREWDLRIDPPARQFFYMPLVHSECLPDQERAVRLMKTRLPESETNLLHARAHREVIRQFGRFPTRNAALGRANKGAEGAYLEAGGYGAIVRKLQDERAA